MVIHGRWVTTARCSLCVYALRGSRACVLLRVADVPCISYGKKVLQKKHHNYGPYHEPR